MLLTRPPLGPKPSCDLHALGTPPTFILSQDQTLQNERLQVAVAARIVSCLDVSRVPDMRAPPSRFPVTEEARPVPPDGVRFRFCALSRCKCALRPLRGRQMEMLRNLATWVNRRERHFAKTFSSPLREPGARCWAGRSGVPSHPEYCTTTLRACTRERHRRAAGPRREGAQGFEVRLAGGDSEARAGLGKHPTRHRRR